MKERKLKRKVRENFEAAGPLQDGKFGREKNKETLESRRIVLQLFEGSYPLRQWFPLGTTIELFLNGVVKKVVRRSQITFAQGFESGVQSKFVAGQKKITTWSASKDLTLFVGYLHLRVNL